MLCAYIYGGSTHSIQYVGIWFKFSFLSFPHKLMVLPMMVVVIQQNQVSISVTKQKEGSLLPTT